MKGEWCYFAKRFDRDFCQRVLELGLTLPDMDAKLGTVNSTVRQDFRRSRVRFIDCSDARFEFLFDSMWKLALIANDQWFDVHLLRLPYIQLAEYDAAYQGEYKEHHDVFWINNDPKYHRKLSGIVQLSDPADYDGGDFELMHLAQSPNPQEIRQQGSVVFFPSFLPHRANPVTRGIRYSLACWFDGPKWR